MEEQSNEERRYDDPIIEATVHRSKNGRFIVHKTVITHIKPAAYYEAILRDNKQQTQEAQQ